MTPDRGSVVDRHAAMDPVPVISSRSRRGFERSAAVARLFADGRSAVAFAPFAPEHSP